MNKKIFGMFISILLIATLFPEVGVLNDRTKTSVLANNPHGEIAPITIAGPPFPVAVISISLDGNNINDGDYVFTGIYYLDATVCRTEFVDEPTGSTATVIYHIVVYQWISGNWEFVMSPISVGPFSFSTECSTYVFPCTWTVSEAGHYRICAWIEIDVSDTNNHFAVTTEESPYCVVFIVDNKPATPDLLVHLISEAKGDNVYENPVPPPILQFYENFIQIGNIAYVFLIELQNDGDDTMTCTIQPTQSGFALFGELIYPDLAGGSNPLTVPLTSPPQLLPDIPKDGHLFMVVIVIFPISITFKVQLDALAVTSANVDSVIIHT